MQFFLHLRPSNCVSVLTFKKKWQAKKNLKKRLYFPSCVRFYILGGMFRIHAGGFYMLGVRAWEIVSKRESWQPCYSSYSWHNKFRKSMVCGNMPNAALSACTYTSCMRNEIALKHVLMSVNLKSHRSLLPYDLRKALGMIFMDLAFFFSRCRYKHSSPE